MENATVAVIKREIATVRVITPRENATVRASILENATVAVITRENATDRVITPREDGTVRVSTLENLVKPHKP